MRWAQVGLLCRTNLAQTPPQQCEDVKEKIGELIPLLKRFEQNFTTAASDGDQAEKRRRSELSGYVCRPLNTPTLVNGFLRTLEEIEKQSRALLEKGTAARFLDKGEDSKMVARLIERLREAITHYQVSENCLVAPSTTHSEADIAAASNLRSNHHPRRKHFTACSPDIR